MIKSTLKALMRQTPYRVVRAQEKNRFSAIDEVLSGLAKRGFRPSCIIDGGANVGDFAVLAKSIFPEARIDLIEPQPHCRAELAKQQSKFGFRLHEVALVGPDYEEPSVTLAVDPEGITTGAHVSYRSDDKTVQVGAATLDALVADTLTPTDVVFLKLDLQGYELQALSGGKKVLSKTHVVLTEVSFFAQAYEPPIAALVAFLSECDFILYDVAAVGARPRDGRARQGDFVFVKSGSLLAADTSWD